MDSIRRREDEEGDLELHKTHRDKSNKQNTAQVIFDIEKVLNARLPEMNINEFPE